MKLKKRSGTSSKKSGGFGKKVVSTVAAGVITFSSLPSKAQDAMIYYGFGPKGQLFIVEDVNSRPPPDTRYSMTAAGRRLPDGSRHSGTVPRDTKYDMSVRGRRMPDGSIHSGLVSAVDYKKLKHSNFLPADVARYDPTKPYGGQIPWSVRSRGEILEEKQKVYRVACEERKEELKEYKARVEERKKTSAERKAKEGLMELNFFKYYFEYVGENYRIAPINIGGQTVALFAYSQDHPEVVACYDRKLMTRLSNKKKLYQIKCDKYEEELQGLRADPNITLHEIIETGVEEITASLEERRVRSGKGTIDSGAFISGLQKSRPYILGPGYKATK